MRGTRAVSEPREVWLYAVEADPETGEWLHSPALIGAVDPNATSHVHYDRWQNADGEMCAIAVHLRAPQGASAKEKGS